MTQDAPIGLAAEANAGEETLTGRITLSLAGEPTAFEITLPAGDVSVDAMLPVFRGLVDATVAAASRRAQAGGAAIACRAGCGACCRQLVPVSEPEARALAAVVAALPEPRRAAVQARFAAARAAVADAGLAGPLTAATRGKDDDLVALGLRYFRLGLACPFLEAESCSIHPDRPLACREFLVTSPAEHCADPSPETVRVVETPRLSVRVGEVARAATAGGWLPLIDALAFAAASPAPPPQDSGPDLLRAVIAGAGDPPP